MLFADASLLAALDIQGGDSVAMPTIEFGDAYRQWLAAGSGAELPKLVSTDDAWLLFTSGTTGQPKGAVLTHRSLCAGLESAASGRPVQAGDRYLYPFPLFHVSAHNVLLQHKFGAAVVLLTGFDASKVLHSIQEFGVTTLSLAPTMLAMLFDHPDFNPRVFDGVRTIGYGASAMPEGLLRKFMSQCDTGLSGGYGMTELSGSVAFLGPEEHRLVLTSRSELLGSVGKPTVGVDLRLLDEAGSEVPPGATGEIVVRGPQVMDRYWDDPEATMVTVVEGWLHTGDIGRFDEAGNLYIVDRKKDLIITGGENVSSREVEEVLVRHPQVSQAAVVGLEDPRWGEAVWAAVVVSPGSEMIGEELLEYCRSQLAGYKTPKQLQIVKELPVNASGKIDKRQVRELLRLGTYAVFPAAP
jgi:acyl-CoA synthetase (AMP-forming)/AMP-acid ligase II